MVNCTVPNKQFLFQINSLDYTLIAINSYSFIIGVFETDNRMLKWSGLDYLSIYSNSIAMEIIITINFL